MPRVHLFLDNELIRRSNVKYIPGRGDTVRVDKDRYAIVTEVIWCIDEEELGEQRVNIRMQTELK